MHLFIASILLAAGAAASSPPPPPSSACDQPECRQFDFWVGDWEVRNADGRILGSNRIEKILGGCVLEENWSGARGLRGRSFNLYDASDRRWHQTWVDSQGSLLLLAGGLRDGRMVMEGVTTQPDGKTLAHRITWEPLPDGRVRQHWETSPAGGSAWTDAFLGFYNRRTAGKQP